MTELNTEETKVLQKAERLAASLEETAAFLREVRDFIRSRDLGSIPLPSAVGLETYAKRCQEHSAKLPEQVTNIRKMYEK